MGKQQIFEKLKQKLETLSLSEADVVYVLSRVRKILEIDKKKKDKGILNFYCNLALHSRIDDVPEQISKSLTKIKDGTDYSNSIIGFEDFHKEFKIFLKENELSESIYTTEKRVREFNKLLLDVCSDTPIILKNKYQITLNSNGIISGSPYIET